MIPIVQYILAKRDATRCEYLSSTKIILEAKQKGKFHQIPQKVHVSVTQVSGKVVAQLTNRVDLAIFLRLIQRQLLILFPRNRQKEMKKNDSLETTRSFHDVQATSLQIITHPHSAANFANESS